jgi:DNA mismatch repair protein MutS2
METKSDLVGIEVAIKGTSTRGIVQEVIVKKDICIVEINGKRLKIPLSDVVIPEQGKKKSKKKADTKGNSRSDAKVRRSSSQETLSIDLHGKTRAEANELLLSLLDKALLQGAEKLEIVHGHGNGILKKEVTEFLSQSPYVGSYNTPEKNKGMIIAHLK